MKTLNAVVALLLGLAVWPQAGRCALVSDEAALASAFRAAQTQVAAWKALSPNPRPLFKAGFTLALNAPDQDWQAIRTKLKDHGEYVAEDDPIPACFRLTDIRGSTTAAHIADYVSIVGFVDSAGVFQPGFVAFVSEDWKIGATDKNWHIDQWIYTADLYGQVTAVTHKTFAETDYGKVFNDHYDDINDASPAAQAKYKALIALWSAFQPQETNQ